MQSAPDIIFIQVTWLTERSTDTRRRFLAWIVGGIAGDGMVCNQDVFTTPVENRARLGCRNVTAPERYQVGGKRPCSSWQFAGYASSLSSCGLGRSRTFVEEA
jgi:hypothetical protein